MKNASASILLFLVSCIFLSPAAFAQQKLLSATRTSASAADIPTADQRHIVVDFYAENILRLYIDSSGRAPHEPVATPVAHMLTENARSVVSKVSIREAADSLRIASSSVEIAFDKATGNFSITDLQSKRKVLQSVSPFNSEDQKTTVTFREFPDEYFFGGGVQNGRFSHKSKIVAIENQNSWTDGGVASPRPFYWSTAGYGILWHTFSPGRYDFGATKKGEVRLFHNQGYADLFIFTGKSPVDILNGYYALTGRPVLLPKFAFYEGHLNAYNRDYWTKDTSKKGQLFEDGQYYTESQKSNGGIRETLNGEAGNYLFSARAVVDRYAQNDMPLGWVLPNDGYGAGYGQTGTLDSNILNLKSFGSYARSKGVEIGLWTQSELHPKEGISPLLQRDIIKEVRDAGVRVLKTDVAWVGAGYSFGLNGIEDAAKIMSIYGNDARPFIITLDGWAGTQRFAADWTGDQSGGQWEYIRFHLPTYIGSGLSGQPNITSDVDGIFGGKNIPVNVRDYQWKTFTPMQLNMDGWGSSPKYPSALGEPATSINRSYLKLKSALMPYSYSIAHAATRDKPMIRALFLDEPNTYTLSDRTQYQFLYGPYFLIAPVYKVTQADTAGNDIRDNVYLPKGRWTDYFTGETYEGGKIYNHLQAPLWKLPVFVKAGGIIPMTAAHNQPNVIDRSHRIIEFFPGGNSSFELYDDDGVTNGYLRGEFSKTTISSKTNGNTVNILLSKTKMEKTFNGFEKMQSTELRVNTTTAPTALTVLVNGKTLALKKVQSVAELNAASNAWYFGPVNFNPIYENAGKEAPVQKKQLVIRLEKTDVLVNDIHVTILGYRENKPAVLTAKTGRLSALHAEVKDAGRKPFSLTPSWKAQANADYYEVLWDGMLYTTIRDTAFNFVGLQSETKYAFNIRAVNKSGKGPWTMITATTTDNPLKDAIRDISARNSARNQPGEGIANFFDFDESTIWHTRWDTSAIPFTLTVDLKSINRLSKIKYVPRKTGKNGVWQQGKFYFSTDKNTWLPLGEFNWNTGNDPKTIDIKGQPAARFLKIEVTKAVGNFGSGSELYVYRVPGTASLLPGDVNDDKIIDRNDLTSFLNYTGLRRGDADFEGYISKGDLNGNGLIDAYDISAAATQLDGGAEEDSPAALAGSMELAFSKTTLSAGETLDITVKGKGFALVNALSFALPYDGADYDFISVQPLAVKGLDNFTTDRLHSNKSKALYPTFVNVGNKPTINGDNDLFIIRLRAKRSLNVNLKMQDAVLADKRHMGLLL